MHKTELPKRYEPAELEQKWYRFWEEEGFFTPVDDPERPKFSIVIPPPNVTGRLHIGHALVNTLQDIIVRWKRMSGFNTLWLPGTDHAGIATQMVVERDLAKQGISRREIGREKFIERVWQWKDEHGNQIIDQLKRLGSSCDWSRTRFTLDEGLSRAVRHVFVRLYEDGLIYRDLAMVNWCPRCQTAISDIEVEYRETQGRLYHIDYPVTGTDRRLTVATTRPETMLGDTAVAVHPDDDRYRDLIGGTVRLPLTSRTIPIVADGILVDPAFGTGVVKVTPAHDKNDYEAGKRHDLAQIQVIDETGKMTEEAGSGYAHLDRFEARKKVIDDLREEGLLGEIKPYEHSVGYCAKCDTAIEPMVSRQWFVRIDPLAKPALDAVRNGTISITPQSWEATYFNWMENIHDWCISRQLWWGHRIPAWYCACGEVIVSEETPEKCAHCGNQELRQETDVLDTWFSSALWPFSTMGWPDETSDLRTFYPTDTLITGFDILFFWVARMIMMGLRFTGKVPFTQVFLNGLVRDEEGQKMSKSKGNVIDPLEVIEEFGADAVRFTLAILATGRDIPLAKNRMAGYSAFGTKIWNASRFALMHIEGDLSSASPIDGDELAPVERWILSRANHTTDSVNKALSAFRFDEAANQIYQFVWHEFCDWYIEMAKPVLLGKEGNPKDQKNAKRVLLEVLDRSLRLLHPFMPFVSEEIWQKLGGVEPSVMVAPYPIADEMLDDPEAERRVAIIQGMVTTIRNVRAERGYQPGDRFRIFLRVEGEEDIAFFQAHSYLLVDLARASEVRINEPVPADAHRDVIGTVELGIELPEQTLSPEQIAKIGKEIEQVEREIANIDGRLANPGFLEKAPAQVVEQSRTRRVELVARLGQLRQNVSTHRP
ncbi:MAG: valine--tRNA ligase [Thermoanaerobaculia bacterium]